TTRLKGKLIFPHRPKRQKGGAFISKTLFSGAPAPPPVFFPPRALPRREDRLPIILYAYNREAVVLRGVERGVVLLAVSELARGVIVSNEQLERGASAAF